MDNSELTYHFNVQIDFRNAYYIAAVIIHWKDSIAFHAC